MQFGAVQRTEQTQNTAAPPANSAWTLLTFYGVLRYIISAGYV